MCVETFEQSMASRKKMIKNKCKKMENPLNFVLPLYRQTSFVLPHHIACYLAPFPSFGAVLMPAQMEKEKPAETKSVACVVTRKPLTFGVSKFKP